MVGLLTFFVLLTIGFFFGRAQEARHFRVLEAAEAEMAHIQILTVKTLPEGLAPGAELVTGNVVIAIDYFKSLMASIRMVFGGRLNAYDSLMERARREAVLRVQREADRIGANAVYNIKLETSTIGQAPQPITGMELLAYGTAVKFANVATPSQTLNSASDSPLTPPLAPPSPL